MAPLLTIGFRPFYLAAAIFAALAIPVWYAAYAGHLLLQPALPGIAWHAHEMVFGFAPAVIAGFLLTAVRNWTGRPTASGAVLAGLVGLWAAGRVLLLTGPAPLAAVVDAAFLPVVAAHLTVPLWRSRNRRNAFVVPLLLVLGLLCAAHHAAWQGALSAAWTARAWTVGLDLVAVLLTVVGGRVIPNFSANAIPGLDVRRWPQVEWLSLGALLAVLLVDVLGFAGTATPLRWLLLTAAGLHLWRLAGWRPWATRGDLLLAVLPLGYLWIPIHLLLRALEPVPGQMGPLAAHALTVGAMAGLMLAMMTRSALGHTGRALRAGAAETVMFAAIHLAAVARVIGPVIWPQPYLAWTGAAAVLWTVAFAAFVIRYTPIVVAPRADGG